VDDRKPAALRAGVESGAVEATVAGPLWRIIEGCYLIADLPKEAHARVTDLNRRFDELNLGFVDAAVVALAGALGLSRIATTDRRHFDPLAALSRSS
jgi:hypothetical protein